METKMYEPTRDKPEAGPETNGQPCRPAPPYEYPEFEQVHLIEYVNVLLKRRWLVIAGVFFCVLLTGIVSKKTPPTFTAAAKFLPSKNPEMSSRMGSLIGAGGKIESLEENVTSEYYQELLGSAEFLERIAARKFRSVKAGGEVDLYAYYKIKGADEAQKKAKVLKAISGSLKTSVSRTTKVVSISYSAKERGLAADVVNAFLEELDVYNQSIKDSKSKQNRDFIEKQVGENQKLLRKAEAALAEFTARNKRIATPDLEMELDRLKRTVRVQEEVYITLKRQFELAKIEEQEKKPVVEIIQRAVPALYKSAPKTMRNVVLAAFLSFFAFAGLAFVLEWLGKMDKSEARNKEFLRHVSDIKGEIRRVTRLGRRG